jgi:hypothetical protein
MYIPTPSRYPDGGEECDWVCDAYEAGKRATREREERYGRLEMARQMRAADRHTCVREEQGQG